METKSGKVKSISTKRPGFYSFCLVDDSEAWYSGKGSPGFKKGDEVSFTFVTTQNGQYTNRNITKLDVKSSSQGPSVTSSEFRSNVDAGNAVSFAKDILIAQGKPIADLEHIAKECAIAFLAAKKVMEGKPEEIYEDAIETQNFGDY